MLLSAVSGITLKAAARASPAGGSGDTAGPLRAALLLRGMRAAPGSAKQVSAGAGGAVSGAGRRPACPGDARGAGASSSGGGAPAAAPVFAGILNNAGCDRW